MGLIPFVEGFKQSSSGITTLLSTSDPNDGPREIAFGASVKHDSYTTFWIVGWTGSIMRVCGAHEFELFSIAHASQVSLGRWLFRKWHTPGLPISACV